MPASYIPRSSPSTTLHTNSIHQQQRYDRCLESYMYRGENRLTPAQLKKTNPHTVKMSARQPPSLSLPCSRNIGGGKHNNKKLQCSHTSTGQKALYICICPRSRCIHDLQYRPHGTTVVCECFLALCTKATAACPRCKSASPTPLTWTGIYMYLPPSPPPLPRRRVAFWYTSPKRIRSQPRRLKTTTQVPPFVHAVAPPSSLSRSYHHQPGYIQGTPIIPTHSQTKSETSTTTIEVLLPENSPLPSHSHSPITYLPRRCQQNP